MYKKNRNLLKKIIFNWYCSKYNPKNNIIQRNEKTTFYLITLRINFFYLEYCFFITLLKKKIVK